MILLLTNILGESIEIINTSNHYKFIECLNKTVNELEFNGILLVNQTTNYYEFATIENGLDCVLFIADDYCKII